MNVRAEVAAELDDVVDIVVEVEIALGQRHLARVDPVGDVHVVVGQQRLDRAAEQGGEMAAHGRHDQNLGVAPRRVPAEMQELPEWLAQQDLFVDRDGFVADLRRVQPEGRLGIGLGEAGHNLGAGRNRLAEPCISPRIIGA